MAELNVFDEAVKLGLYELNWAINQARDNGGEEASKAEYLKFATTYARDPFLMAQLSEQTKVKEFLLDPENAAAAKELFDLTVTIQTKMEAMEAGSWSRLGEIIAMSIDSIKESELVTPATAERIGLYHEKPVVFLTMVIIYYTIREYNMILTGAYEGETLSERPH